MHAYTADTTISGCVKVRATAAHARARACVGAFACMHVRGCVCVRAHVHGCRISPNAAWLSRSPTARARRCSRCKLARWNGGKKRGKTRAGRGATHTTRSASRSFSPNRMVCTATLAPCGRCSAQTRRGNKPKQQSASLAADQDPWRMLHVVADQNRASHNAVRGLVRYNTQHATRVPVCGARRSAHACFARMQLWA